MKPLHYLLAASLVLITGSQALSRQTIDPNLLSGKITLTLDQGVWKMWEEEPVYQDITLDLVCENGRCEPEVWGYAPKYNKDVDHSGTVEVVETEQAWQLQVNLDIQPQPWAEQTGPATYNIELVPYKGQLIGNYTGTFGDRSLHGSISGTINPPLAQPVANHQPVNGEHPRLIFRQSEIPALQAKAKTPTGQAILAQLQQSLTQPIYYDGYVPNGGYHATGHCFLSLLNNDAQAAQKAWEIVEKSIDQSSERLLEQSTIVAGVALAYDLCYHTWQPEQRQQITRWLAGQADRLIKGDSPKRGWNGNAWSNWNARARSAAGLAALAILNEPAEDIPGSVDPNRLAKIAQRNMMRYLTTAIGDRGFGSEGDHYTTEPWFLSVFPFLQAYENVLGQDLVTGSKARWLLPHYITRIVNQDGEVSLPTYGRHRNEPGGAFFALGLETVPQEFLPGVLWFFDRHFGWDGNRSFGVETNFPHAAVFALAGYPLDIKPQNPAATFAQIVEDRQKGFYVFRDQWQDQNDFIASIYTKRESLPGSWSFPEAGSFRIWGLGWRWAKAGVGDGEWENENVVVMPNVKAWQSAKPIFFDSDDDFGVVSMEMSPIVREQDAATVGITSVRSFAADYSGISGAPGLFVVVDQFRGNLNAQSFSNKTWTMHTEGKVTVEGQSFTIAAPDGATMQGTFVAPLGVQIAYQPGEEGGTIKATGGNHFFVVMTVQQGEAPIVDISGVGLQAQVRVGDRQIIFDNNQIKLAP